MDGDFLHHLVDELVTLHRKHHVPHICQIIKRLLPDGLSSEQLNGKIHETFELVRNSVEAELHGSASVIDIPAVPVPGGSRNQGELASPKQISYLLSLAQKRGITAQQLASRYHVATVEQLSRKQCSEIINNWKAA